MTALLLALASSLAYGCADFLGGLSARGTHVLRTAIIAGPASLAVELALWPIFGAAWNPAAVAWGVAAGTASSLAFVLLYRTLAIGPMTVLSPITALVSAVLPVGIGLLQGEHLTAYAPSGVLLALFAVVLVSAGPGARATRPTGTALMLALGAGAAIAAQLICLHQSPTDSGLTPIITSRVTTSLAVLAASAVLRKRLGTERPGLALCVGAGSLDSLANLAFLLAVRSGDLAVVAVITALYPASTVLLARGVLAERIHLSQIAGLGFAAIAVSLLALG